MKNLKSFVLISLFAAVLLGNTVHASWPQFRGPDRNGKSPETNLLKQWPENGPELLWSYEGIGAGYSSASIAGDTIYTAGMIDGQGFAFAFDLQGNLKWKTNYGPEWTRSYGGTRTTPTYNNGKLYLYSGMGKLVCLDAESGKEIWTLDTDDKFKIQQRHWGISESVLVDDENVYCTPGGEIASIIAVNKLTGELVWKTEDLNNPSAYCSALMIQKDQIRIIATMTANFVLFINAENGEIIFKDHFADYQATPNGINPNTPVYKDGYVYTTSGYDSGGAMYKISDDGKTVERVWTDETLDVHHGGVVEVDGYIYGANWKGNGDGDWCCLNWQTGQVMYEHHWNNKGSIIYADGLLYCYEEQHGNVALVEPNPEGFNIISSFQVELGDGKHWAHPSISDGKLYIRHGNVLMCYDIKAK